jgi:hypothetical protein
VGEVRLLSTFNTVASADQRAFLLRESFRVLMPGGAIHVRGLMAEQPLANPSPELTGLVVPLVYVPHQGEVMDALCRAGFFGVEVVNASHPPRFVREGIGLHDVHFIARKPGENSASKAVIYKGPFAEAVDDEGRVYPRGRRVLVPAAVWDMLRRGLAAECFLFLNADGSVSGCSSSC